MPRAVHVLVSVRNRYVHVLEGRVEHRGPKSHDNDAEEGGRKAQFNVLAPGQVHAQ